MKPINAETKAKKSPAKGAAGAKKGPKAVAGTVKKSVSKAKTNVVKASRKKLNKAAKEEVDELLDKTANGSPDVVDGAAIAVTPTVTVTPSASGKAVAVAAAKTKKIKSMVSLNSYNKMEEEPVTPVRQSKRISARAAAAAGNESVSAAPNGVDTNGDATNGHSDVKMADISVAEEAVEPEPVPNAAGPGFLKKTISRIWGSTSNGGTYQEVGGEGEDGKEAPAAAPAAENGKSCVIS